MSQLTIAVVGATGAVGREMINTLVQRGLPVDSLVLLASERSAGVRLDITGDITVTVQALTEDSFAGVDIALFSAGAAVSREFGPAAVAAGAVVIDNSSAFRMEPEVPLVVPEVNADLLRQALRGGSNGSGRAGLMIANPNCSTIQLVVALQPLLEHAGLRRVVVSTYQSVSGAGQKGLDELWGQSLAIFNQQELLVSKFPHQIAYNCIPHIDLFTESGYTKEEVKVIQETRKIMGLPQLKITATAVRVPVFHCHSESVNVETERRLSPAEARDILRRSPGIIVVDDPGEQLYPMSIDVAGTDAVFVGRIRTDDSTENGLNLWVVADNLRKGAALNAVQIAEIVLAERFPSVEIDPPSESGYEGRSHS